jgi:hypothetical protein
VAHVSLNDAKTHLRVKGTAHDADVQMKVDAASAIVLDYLKANADPTWDETTTPLPIKTAILMMTAYLYEHRGDDPATRDDLYTDKGIWAEIDPILIRFRHPAYR